MKDTEFERLSQKTSMDFGKTDIAENIGDCEIASPCWSGYILGRPLSKPFETVNKTKDRIRMELFKDVYVAAVSRGEGLAYSKEMAKNAIISFDNIFKEPGEE